MQILQDLIPLKEKQAHQNPKMQNNLSITLKETSFA